MLISKDSVVFIYLFMFYFLCVSYTSIPNKAIYVLPHKRSARLITLFFYLFYEVTLGSAEVILPNLPSPQRFLYKEQQGSEYTVYAAQKGERRNMRLNVMISVNGIAVLLLPCACSVVILRNGRSAMP